MTLYCGFFYLLALLITLATGLAIVSRHLVHTVVYLIISFLGTALLFYLLGAPMVAALEVVIQAGAVMVLFLMVVMFLRVEEAEGGLGLPKGSPLILLLGGVGFALALFFLTTNPSNFFPLHPAMVAPQQFGTIIFEKYWLAVEGISFLLFVALVGAYYLSRGEAAPRSASGE